MSLYNLYTQINGITFIFNDFLVLISPAKKTNTHYHEELPL